LQGYDKDDKVNYDLVSVIEHLEWHAIRAVRCSHSSSILKERKEYNAHLPGPKCKLLESTFGGLVGRRLIRCEGSFTTSLLLMSRRKSIVLRDERFDLGAINFPQHRISRYSPDGCNHKRL